MKSVSSFAGATQGSKARGALRNELLLAFQLNEGPIRFRRRPVKAFVVDKYKKKGGLVLVNMPEPELQDNDVLPQPAQIFRLLGNGTRKNKENYR